jgi:hypothetical protein
MLDRERTPNGFKLDVIIVIDEIVEGEPESIILNLPVGLSYVVYTCPSHLSQLTVVCFELSQSSKLE